MSFKNKVESIDQIKSCYRKGKQAIENQDALKIREALTNNLDGSVALDDCLKKEMPNDHRWDYIIGYGGKAYFVEVHPATDGEVQKIISKYNWLLNWLKNEGAPLLPIKADDAFHWLFTNKYSLTRNSAAARKLTKAGIPRPKRELRLK